MNRPSPSSSELVVIDDAVPDLVAPRQQIGSPAALSAAQIVAIMRAYWKLTLLIAVTVTVLAGVVTKLMPKTYTSTATLMV
ncbi:MAG TPA: hypothetical protein VEE84_02495, partial [Burkholderiaceae bacterium]|nr:hypothetical protein [Burkholderiaceae bacterium]